MIVLLLLIVALGHAALAQHADSALYNVTQPTTGSDYVTGQKLPVVYQMAGDASPSSKSEET